MFRWAVAVSLCAAITLLGGLADVAVTIKDVKSGEDVMGYLQRTNKKFDQELYKQICRRRQPVQGRRRRRRSCCRQ